MRNFVCSRKWNFHMHVSVDTVACHAVTVCKFANLHVVTIISRKTLFVTKSDFFTSIWVIKFSICQFHIIYVTFHSPCSFETQLSDSMNYKTVFYANLADVTGNFVCWGEILTHDHLSIEKRSKLVSFKRQKVIRNARARHGHFAKNQKSSCQMIGNPEKLGKMPCSQPLVITLWMCHV